MMETSDEIVTLKKKKITWKNHRISNYNPPREPFKQLFPDRIFEIPLKSGVVKFSMSLSIHLNEKIRLWVKLIEGSELLANHVGILYECKSRYEGHKIEIQSNIEDLRKENGISACDSKQNHELFGKCMNNRCKKLHFKLCRNYMSSLHCDYQNCKYLHPKRLRSNIQSQNSMSSQVYKGITPIYAQNVRKSFTPRRDLFDHSPFGHAQQPAINENNEFHLCK